MCKFSLDPFLIFTVVRRHVTFKFKVFHLWQTYVASDSTGSPVRGLFFIFDLITYLFCAYIHIHTYVYYRMAAQTCWWMHCEDEPFKYHLIIAESAVPLPYNVHSAVRISCGSYIYIYMSECCQLLFQVNINADILVLTTHAIKW